MSKIIAIHGGGDWADASAEYIILPEGVDYHEEQKKWREWYDGKYCPSLKHGAERIEFIGTLDWLIKAGARLPTDDELTVKDDF